MIQEDIDLGPGLIAAKDRAEWRRVGRITGDAFGTDPFNRWLLGTQGAIDGVFGALARHVYGPRGVTYRLGDIGAAMWMLPEGDMEPPLAALPSLYWSILVRARRGAKDRVDATVAAMAAAHPAFPHAYLFSIGVCSHARGKGHGRTLIAPVLAECDRAGIPAYLENSNPANRGFYAASGFEHVGFIEPRPDAPPLEAMLRQPRAPAT